MPEVSGATSTRAIVLGAGMAGLAAARVLSDSFSEVILLERDSIDLKQQVRRQCSWWTIICPPYLLFQFVATQQLRLDMNCMTSYYSMPPRQHASTL